MKWLKKIKAALKAKQYTSRKVRERYLLQDIRYLKKAYKYGHDFIKRMAVTYLGEFKTQENYDFLLLEMRNEEDEMMKSYLYYSILNMVLNDEIVVSDLDSFYLDKNFYLLDKFKKGIPYKTKPSKGTPIIFRNQIGDHLELLEDMKKQFEQY